MINDGILNLESLMAPNLNTTVPSSQEIGSERLCDLHGRIMKSPEVLFSSQPSPLSFFFAWFSLCTLLPQCA